MDKTKPTITRISNRGPYADRGLAQLDATLDQVRAEARKGHRPFEMVLEKVDGYSLLRLSILPPDGNGPDVTEAGTQAHVLDFNGFTVTLAGDVPQDVVASVNAAVRIAITPPGKVSAAAKAGTPTDVLTAPAVELVQQEQQLQQDPAPPSINGQAE